LGVLRAEIEDEDFLVLHWVDQETL
jgi:hypothetical protein